MGEGGGGLLAMLKGGAQKAFGVVLTQELEVLAILTTWRTFPPFKRGGAANSFTLSGGGPQGFGP